jgi:hypothetical protein
MQFTILNLSRRWRDQLIPKSPGNLSRRWRDQLIPKSPGNLQYRARAQSGHCRTVLVIVIDTLYPFMLVNPMSTICVNVRA